MATPQDQVEARRGVAGSQLAIVVGLLVALLVAMWFIFLRGDDEVVEATAPVAPPVSSPAPEEPEPQPNAGNKPGKGPVETFELFAAKDPFEPLVDPNASAGSGATGGTAPGEGGTGEGTSGEGGTGTGSGGISGGGGEDVGGHRVRLIDVFTKQGSQRAQVQVDGTVYTVNEGEVFADSFELLSVSGECVTMLFGDDQFTICEGEEILK